MGLQGKPPLRMLLYVADAGLCNTCVLLNIARVARLKVEDGCWVSGVG